MASASVFSTTELLEHILLHLSPKDALLAQRVCKYFRHTIKGSIALQRHSWLQPQQSISGDAPFKLNPVLFAKAKQIRSQIGVLSYSTVDLIASTMRFGFSYTIIGDNSPVIDYHYHPDLLYHPLENTSALKMVLTCSATPIKALLEVVSTTKPVSGVRCWLRAQVSIRVGRVKDFMGIAEKLATVADLEIRREECKTTARDGELLKRGLDDSEQAVMADMAIGIEWQDESGQEWTLRLNEELDQED